VKIVLLLILVKMESKRLRDKEEMERDKFEVSRGNLEVLRAIPLMMEKPFWRSQLRRLALDFMVNQNNTIQKS